MLDPLERIIQHSDNGVHNYLTGRGWEASILYLLAQVMMAGHVVSCVRAPINQRSPWLELPSDEGPCGMRFVPSYSFLGQQFALTLYVLDCRQGFFSETGLPVHNVLGNSGLLALAVLGSLFLGKCAPQDLSEED
jgi:hypothetical protein